MEQYPAPHDDAPLRPVPHRVVATWPVGYFVENIAPLPGGGFVVSVHNRRELHRVDADGAARLWATLPVSPAGLIAADDGVFAVGGEPGVGPHRLLKITGDGRVEDRGAIPDTLFLNGFTPGPPGRAYAVNSIAGVVLDIDLATGAAKIVLRDEKLTKSSADPLVPGANGIKAGHGALWITSTDRALVLRAPLGPDGPTGTAETVAERLRGDDLALDVDGDLYITNHIHNTLIRLRRNGARTAIAGPAEGMAGSTACAFGTRPEESSALFVTTTGGMIMPLDGIVQEAKLVRLEVGARGLPIGSTAV